MGAMRILAGLLLAAAAAGCAQRAGEDRPGARTTEDSAIFDTRTDADFGDASPELRALVAATSPKPSGSQHFCIVGYRDARGGEWAWVHWREERRLILWNGRAGPDDAHETLVLSQRSLDLDEDVVATESDIAGSSYLITRAWRDARLADCDARGARYRIEG